MDCMSSTRGKTHLEMSTLKALAPLNMFDIIVTFEMSHFEMSVLKVFLLENTEVMRVTSDVSHSLMSLPYGVVPVAIQSVTAL